MTLFKMKLNISYLYVLFYENHEKFSYSRILVNILYIIINIGFVLEQVEQTSQVFMAQGIILFNFVQLHRTFNSATLYHAKNNLFNFTFHEVEQNLNRGKTA